MTALSRGARALFLLGAAVFFGLPLLWLLLAPTRTADDLTTGSPWASARWATWATPGHT